MKILRFRTGRGGHFRNQGHVSFVKFETIHKTSAFDSYFPTEEVDQWGHQIILTEGGDHLDYEKRKDGTGYINDDGEYDTTTWVLEDSLNRKQIEAIKREFDNEIPIYEAEELKEIYERYDYETRLY